MFLCSGSTAVIGVLVSLDFFFFSGNLLLGGWVLVESMGMIA